MISRSSRLHAYLAACLLASLVACGAAQDSDRQAPTDGADQGTAAGTGTATGMAPEAHQGATASSGRPTFAPTRLSYRRGSEPPIWSEIDAVRTLADGRLDLPPADRIGWWSGSAEAGQKLGSIVLAGHVDSTEGLGFMAALLGARPGDRITLTGSGERQRFQITGTRTVARARLADDADWNDQAGPLQLVLITCYGRYDPVAGDYAQNLIITASPLN